MLTHGHLLDSGHKTSEVGIFPFHFSTTQPNIPLTLLIWLVCRIVVHEGVESGEGACPSPGSNTISTINNNNTINTINTK